MKFQLTNAIFQDLGEIKIDNLQQLKELAKQYNNDIIIYFNGVGYNKEPDTILIYDGLIE